MTDEIQRTSPAPWLIGGAAVGGTGAGVALTKIEKLKEWTTEPKYASHEDILKEKHDTLVKQAEEASEESKNVWDEIVKGHKEIEDAEATWETQKNEYVKNNSVAKPVEDTEEIKNLNKKLEELKTELAEGEKTTKTTKTVTEKVAKQNSLEQKLQELEGKNSARRKAIEMNQEIADLKSKINAANQTKKKVTVPQVQSDLDAFNRFSNEHNVRAINGIKQRMEALKKAETDLNKLIDKEATKLSMISQKSEALPTAISNSEQEIEKFVDSLRGLTTEQKKAIKQECKTELKGRVGVMGHVQSLEARLARATDEYNRLPKTAREMIETERTVFETVEKDGKKVTQSVKKGSKLDALIQQTDKEIAEVKTANDLLAKRKAHVQKMWKQRQEARKMKYTHIGDMTLGDIGKPTEFKYQDFESTLKDSEKDIYKKYRKDMRTSGTTTVERVEEVLTRAMTDEQIAAKQKEIADVTADIASKREALPKQVVKTAEELATEYATKNPKEAFVKTTTENVTNRLKDSLEQAMKETTKRNGLKFWGPIAGAAVGLGLLAAAIRPKTKSQA